MAELASIARPYADALFKAVDQDQQKILIQWLENVAAVAALPELRVLIANPQITVDLLLSVFADITKTEWPAVAKNLLRVLIENNRIQVLPELVQQFKLLVNKQSGVADGIVYSPFPMSAADVVQIQASLEKRFNKKLNLTVKLDDSLIGGIRVVVGDEVLDTSVKARLEKMKAVLAA